MTQIGHVETRRPSCFDERSEIHTGKIRQLEEG
jgi:hypothetical protein